jgi:hypothetical protein
MRQIELDFLIISLIVALIVGVLILFFPRLLNNLVAIYLIIVGILGIIGAFTQELLTVMIKIELTNKRTRVECPL